MTIPVTLRNNFHLLQWQGEHGNRHVLGFGFQSLFHSAVLSDSEERRTVTMKKK